ncbi:MAG: nodulation protein NfeD, partial [Candidatus Dadabacteria bacterium]
MLKVLRLLKNSKLLLQIIVISLFQFVLAEAWAGNNKTDGPFVAVIDMNMMILPGTQEYLESAIERASQEGAEALVVKLDTPGGMLTSSQEMIQAIFKSPVPVIVYVFPSGASATSAGVFITVAAHIAAMAPGTSIGAAHPVMGNGKDIEGDMRKKAENITVAMVKSVAEQRGRNVDWVEKAVKESSSLTEKEALKKKVIDIVATDLNDLLKQIKGRKVKVNSSEVVLKDLSKLPRKEYKISFKQKTINVLANPNIAALLWLGATTGLSLELYHPGAIVPGVVGVICLILALAVSQIIPISMSGVLLMIVGSLLIGAEMYVTSGVLGLGGIIALVLGSIYLVDGSRAPDLAVAMDFIIPVIIVVVLFMVWVIINGIKTLKRKPETTGIEGMIGQ